MKAIEVNFDGIVGPTYCFGGLSYGNVASMKHKSYLSSPKKAALEGLKKMKYLMDLGLTQAVLPPQERPNLAILNNLGFSGAFENMLKKASQYPSLLEALSSSASMWTANSATVIPSADSADGKVHFSIANLLNRFHRAIESEETYRLFKLLFHDQGYFTVHPPLPKGGGFGDEGAANHTRFCEKEGEKGVHLFVYGKSAFEESGTFYPSRQALEASQASARRGGLSFDACVFAKQNPELIDLGVFHNDVISVGHHLTYLVHEKTFQNREKTLQELQDKTLRICKKPLNFILVTEEMLSAKEAVDSYFFNSQLLTTKDGKNFLLAPEECRQLNLKWLPFPIHFIDVRQSMQNGGGPACLRLRVELTEKELSKVHPFVFLNEKLYQELTSWVNRHYPDRLDLADLADPHLFQKNQEALDALTQILHLGSFYNFQKETEWKT